MRILIASLAILISTAAQGQTPTYQRGDKVLMPDSDEPKTIMAVAGETEPSPGGYWLLTPVTSTLSEVEP